MAKKRLKYALVPTVVLAIISCTNNVPNNTSLWNGLEPFPTKENFTDLDKEYRFSTKELTQSYLKRKLERWLTPPVDGPKLLKELIYAKFKHPDLYCVIILEDNGLLADIEIVPQVADRETIDESFRTFIQGCSSFSGDFPVNTFTGQNQTLPAVASDSDGDFVIIWQSNGQDEYYGYYNIYGQRYSSSGTAAGSEFQVSTSTNGYNINPSVSMDNAGDFVVTWQSYDPNNGYYDVFARRYNSSGDAQEPPVQVNQYMDGNQWYPSVAMDNSGDYVIAWQSYGQETDYYNSYYYCDSYNPDSGYCDSGHYEYYGPYYNYSQGVFYRRYNANGTAKEDESQANGYITGDQAFPSVAADEDGDFVISWQTDNQDGSQTAIFAQRINKSNGLEGPEFQVNSYTPGAQIIPSTAMDNNGNFVVTWQSVQDGSNNGIYAQRFNSNGFTDGSEFQVNSFTDFNQFDPAVTMNSTGDFVITWSSENQDGSIFGVFGQGYSSSGSTVGSEFLANSYTTNIQHQPAIAIDNGTNFIIAWEGEGIGDNQGIYARRFSSLSGSGTGSSGSSGGTNTPEFRINVHTILEQNAPEMAMDSNGNFVVVWQSQYQDPDGSYGVYGRRFNADGSASTGEFRLNDYITQEQVTPKVALNQDGTFVVTWFGVGPDDDSGVFARRFFSDGSPDGTQFLVNTFTDFSQGSSDIATDANGNFVITWNSQNQEIVETNSAGVYARIYNNNAVPQGPEFLVNTYTTGPQGSPAIEMNSNGNFVIVWTSFGQETCVGSDYSPCIDGIYAQRFFSDGNLIGSEFLVNTFTSKGQNEPAIGMDSNGDFVIAWRSEGQDGYGDGIFAQRFNSNAEPQVPNGCGTSIPQCNTGTGEFRVNTGTNKNELEPAVAMSSDGSFIIPWTKDTFTIFAQRYNPDGSPNQGQFMVSRDTGRHDHPVVGIADNNKFTFIWAGNLNEDFDSQGGIQGKLFDSNGDLIMPP
jgi:hypothetical protein